MNERSVCTSIARLGQRLFCIALYALLAALTFAPATQANITWDAEGNSHWWFDPVNWGADVNGDPRLPPSENGGANPTRTFINLSGGAWNEGNGVVYDPTNDPFFPAAASFPYPTGYGPQIIWRMAMASQTLEDALLTIRGDLFTDGSAGDTRWEIGRSHLFGTIPNATIVHEGGVVRNNFGDLVLGSIDQVIPLSYGNGTYDYRSGTLEQGFTSGRLQLSGGGSTAVGGVGKFIVHNPTNGGYVRVRDFQVAPFGGVNGIEPDGIETGVGIVEFHYANDGVRPIQVLNNLMLANGQDAADFGRRSSRLALVLDEPVQVDSHGVPQNLGLFDLDNDDDGTGTIVGPSGGANSFGLTFSDADAPNPLDMSFVYDEGDIVTAFFGPNTYRWTISYFGNISWFDKDASQVNSVSGGGTGRDVVLIGLESTVPEPSSLLLLVAGACLAVNLGKRRNRQGPKGAKPSGQ